MCAEGRIKVEVYCRRWEVGCGGEAEIGQMQADI
jgi:hypothetical protein